jgi:hypothetical protein
MTALYYIGHHFTVSAVVVIVIVIVIVIGILVGIFHVQITVIPIRWLQLVRHSEDLPHQSS